MNTTNNETTTPKLTAEQRHAKAAMVHMVNNARSALVDAEATLRMARVAVKAAQVRVEEAERVQVLVNAALEAHGE